MTLLVVDDHEPTQELIDRYFSDKGYQVYTATNLDSVRRLLLKAAVDVAVVDIRLEGYPQGLDVLSQLKEQKSSTIVILITAHIPASRPGAMSLKDEVKRLGADDLIEKSYDVCDRIEISIAERLSPKGGRNQAGSVTCSLAELRQSLQCLDDVQLEALCLDHFAAVYDQFGRGMRRDEKFNLLLDHCRRHAHDAERLTILLGDVKCAHKTGHRN